MVKARQKNLVPLLSGVKPHPRVGSGCYAYPITVKCPLVDWHTRLMRMSSIEIYEDKRQCKLKTYLQCKHSNSKLILQYMKYFQEYVKECKLNINKTKLTVHLSCHFSQITNIGVWFTAMYTACIPHQVYDGGSFIFPILWFTKTCFIVRIIRLLGKFDTYKIWKWNLTKHIRLFTSRYVWHVWNLSNSDG